MKPVATIVTYDYFRRVGFMRTADGRAIHFNLSMLPIAVKQPIIELSRVFNRHEDADPAEWKAAVGKIKQALVGQRFALEVRRKPNGKWGAVSKTLECVGALPEGAPRQTHVASAPINPANFKGDPLFPGIEEAVAKVLEAGSVVSPVEMLVRLGWLSPEDYVRWRSGLLSCLEEVIIADQSKCNRMLRVVQLLAEDLHLVEKAAASAYLHPSTRRPLRFSRTNKPHLEQNYSRHWERPVAQS